MSFFRNRQSEEQQSSEQQPIPPISVSRNPIGFETVIGASCSIEGSLSSKGNIRLDGEFTGTLEITGNVLVGETAKIKADINAKNISIAGSVRGNVSGKKVQLLRTGRVWGDITATALTTEEGAFIDGKISMMSAESSNPDPKLEEPDFVETVEVDALDTDDDDDDDETAFIPRELAKEAMEKVEELRQQQAEDADTNNTTEDTDD